MYLYIYIVLQNYLSVNIELLTPAIISEDKFREVLEDFKGEIKKDKDIEIYTSKSSMTSEQIEILISHIKSLKMFVELLRDEVVEGLKTQI